MTERKRKISTCHPNATHYGKGLCKQCYTVKWNKINASRRHDWYITNRERQLAKGRARYKENKSAILQKTRQWQLANPDKIKNRQLIRRYGISLEDYNQLLIKQNNKCKLCKEGPIHKPVVDHNHLTGAVRGIVCQGCNIIIGFFEVRPKAFAKVSEYILETA